MKSDRPGLAGTETREAEEDSVQLIRAAVPVVVDWLAMPVKGSCLISHGNAKQAACLLLVKATHKM